jgi:hypothetical protein
MSLVHEALLKAEREKQRKTGSAPVLTRWTQPVAPRPAIPREEKPVAPTRMLGLQETPVSPAPAREPGRGNSDAAHVAAPAQKSQQTLLVLVALVAIVAIAFMVNRTASSARNSGPTGTPGSVPAVSPPATAGQASMQQDAGNAGSPTETQPATAASPADASGYKITGIMKDPQGKYCAVINGRVAYVEQYVDGAIVKKIERDRVTLDENGHEFVLRLN